MGFLRYNKKRKSTTTKSKRKRRVNKTAKNSQTVICNECYGEFIALTTRVKDGKAKFCTKSCSTKHAHKSKKDKLKTCKQCSRRFKTKNDNAKYCSVRCSGKNSADKRKLTTVQKEKVAKLKKRGCEICKWSKASCDIHHITPISKGGTNCLSNLITLCPNHHRLADQGTITQVRLNKLIRVRKKGMGF